MALIVRAPDANQSAAHVLAPGDAFADGLRLNRRALEEADEARQRAGPPLSCWPTGSGPAARSTRSAPAFYAGISNSVTGYMAGV